MLNLLDDTPIVPGDAVRPYEQGTAAREILSEAEGDLRAWEPSVVPVQSNAADMGTNLIPKPEAAAAAAPVADGTADSAKNEAVPATEADNVATSAKARESVATDADESSSIVVA